MVEKEGNEKEEKQDTDLNTELVKYIIEERIVYLEEAAAKFGMKTEVRLFLVEYCSYFNLVNVVSSGTAPDSTG